MIINTTIMRRFPIDTPDAHPPTLTAENCWSFLGYFEIAIAGQLVDKLLHEVFIGKSVASLAISGNTPLTRRSVQDLKASVEADRQRIIQETTTAVLPHDQSQVLDKVVAWGTAPERLAMAANKPVTGVALLDRSMRRLCETTLAASAVVFSASVAERPTLRLPRFEDVMINEVAAFESSASMQQVVLSAFHPLVASVNFSK